MGILVLSSHFVQLELYCDTGWKRKTLLSGIQHQVCRHEYNAPPPHTCTDITCSKVQTINIFFLFSSYLISCMFLILLMSFCCCQWKLRWKISWQRPVPPHHLLPFADSGISEEHLKHRDVSEPEFSAFNASLFSFLALLLRCLFAWHHIKTYLCWDFFWNLPIQPQQCPYFPFLLPLTLFICEHSELLLGEWVVPG